MPLTSESTVDQRGAFKKWDRSNHMSLMIIKVFILDFIIGSILEKEDTKVFLKQIANRFTSNEKIETIIILMKIVSM